VLASLQRQLHLVLAHRALQSQHDLLCSLCLLVEHRLRLPTITALLSVVTSLSLCEDGVLSLLVLCHLVRCVLFAGFAFAECSASFGNVDHRARVDDGA